MQFQNKYTPACGIPPRNEDVKDWRTRALRSRRENVPYWPNHRNRHQRHQRHSDCQSNNCKIPDHAVPLGGSEGRGGVGISGAVALPGPCECSCYSQHLPIAITVHARVDTQEGDAASLAIVKRDATECRGQLSYPDDAW